jgi:AAA15 family ATPase/GTPase
VQLIRSVKISHFKSIREAQFDRLGNYSSLAGLNNAGKSNFLRALSAFFTGEVEKGSPLAIDRDYYRPEVSYKKKKIIRVSLAFALPDHFKFRSGLENVLALLTRQFTLTKEWTRDKPEPSIYLNETRMPLNPEDSSKVESFLNLVTFRYIPNRVVPTQIIIREHHALRDLLVRRLARYREQSNAVFDGIRNTADQLTGALSKELIPIAPDINKIRLLTASSLAELVFRFGYSFQEGNVEMTEDEQGSGFQSLLMFQTLRLIDQDYFQKFGWRQAAIWAIEEPEASLHTALEAHVAHYLAAISEKQDNRLQIIATTHSDLFIQYSDGTYIVEKTHSPLPTSPSSTRIEKCDKQETLKRAAKQGIARWVNPILLYPMEPIVLVEGKTDREFIYNANLAYRYSANYRLVCLEDLLEKPQKGGVETLKRFIQANAEAISMRSEKSLVIILLDWDAVDKVPDFQNILGTIPSYIVLAWNEQDANPKLHSSFKGIERFFSDRIIEDAIRINPNLVAVRPDGMKCVQSGDLGRLKNILHGIIRNGLQETDCVFANSMLNRLKQLTD